eukprot:TRINITY_DN51609_c0_g1_i1.p2 TRINITY_DN51609_c0_g1~~TRINITY_DN51609_c0_g1_i1.p2  ORF type:complete len:150 (-),score=0.09 TRINITY_DN51609_c0_g1_i1:28-477(-)
MRALSVLEAITSRRASRHTDLDSRSPVASIIDESMRAWIWAGGLATQLGMNRLTVVLAETDSHFHAARTNPTFNPLNSDCVKHDASTPSRIAKMADTLALVSPSTKEVEIERHAEFRTALSTRLYRASPLRVYASSLFAAPRFVGIRQN